MGELVETTAAPGRAARPHVFPARAGHDLVWMDRRDGRWRIYRERLDADGARRPLTAGYLSDGAPELVVREGEGEYGLAWSDYPGEGEPPALRFARGPLGCE